LITSSGFDRPDASAPAAAPAVQCTIGENLRNRGKCLRS
jgi:hypothetical protein